MKTIIITHYFIFYALLLSIQYTLSFAHAPGPEIANLEGIEPLIRRVDHFVYAILILNNGVAEIEKLLGVRATPGLQNPSMRLL